MKAGVRKKTTKRGCEHKIASKVEANKQDWFILTERSKEKKLLFPPYSTTMLFVRL